jgi:antitoxin MazE
MGWPMETTVTRWGNSLAVRIPGGLARDLALVEGAGVRITAEGGRLVLQPTDVRQDLETLLSGITEENLHGEADWGAPAGAEAW